MEEVERFKYFGVVLTVQKKKKIERTKKNRIQEGWKYGRRNYENYVRRNYDVVE